MQYPELGLVDEQAVAEKSPITDSRQVLLRALHLPDDGGVVVSGIAGGPNSPSERTLYAMKPFAKNGELPNVAGATVQPLATEPLDCGVTAQSWPVTWVNAAATLRSVNTVSEDAALAAE